MKKANNEALMQVPGERGGNDEKQQIKFHWHI